MSEGLKLVVENNIEAVKQENSDTKLRACKIEIHCRNCRTTYSTTIGEMIDSPECKKCGK
jgi:Zn finger protein HypA/HybF involved in hydrogenase expression